MQRGSEGAGWLRGYKVAQRVQRCSVRVQSGSEGAAWLITVLRGSGCSVAQLGCRVAQRVQGGSEGAV